MNEFRAIGFIAPVVLGVNLACGGPSDEATAQVSSCREAKPSCAGDGWVRQFDASAVGLHVDGKGNAYVAGTMRSGFIRKYDTLGEERWTLELGTDAMPRALGGDAAGTVYVAGHTSETLPGQTSAGGTDAFLRSYDESGNERWTRQFGASGEDTACCVAVGPDGTVLVSGHVNGSLPGQAGSGGPDVFVRAYDGDGNERWTRQLGASDVLRPSVSVDGSGNVFVVALGYPEGPVRSYDSEGVELPLRSLGEAADQIGFDANGNAYAVRYTTDARGLDSVVTKYDGDGNVSWTWPLATSEQDVATALRVGQSGPVYVAGDTMGAFSGQTNLGERDVFVSQVDEHGREAWTQQIGTSATDLVGAVSADDVGNVYLVGSSWGDFPGQTSDVLDDAFLMKMPPLDSVSSPP